MKISIGSDHGGLTLRRMLVDYLQAQGHTVIDHGTHSEASVDYPDYAKLVGADVAQQVAEFGILVCTSGIGVCIAANKIKGVRAALVTNDDMAYYSRLHNNANVLCLGEKYSTSYMAKKCLDVFLKTQFEGGRHIQRTQKFE